ncbi:MAG: glycogen/starch/alpha-glucan phosphorylase [Thiotrichales bacterium]
MTDTNSESPALNCPEYDRVGLSKDAIKRSFLDALYYVQGKFPHLAKPNDYYLALAHLVRDRLLQRWISTAAHYTEDGSRTVCYFSAEYLVGPHLENNLINLGISDQVREAMAELGMDLEALIDREEEPGLGNGGLGRLAACYMDSLATLEIPTLGYGIRYEFGIFQQQIVDGWQVELTDKWLRNGNPWEIPRPEWSVEVKLGGYSESYVGPDGRLRYRWVPGRIINGIPYDTPVLGYRLNTANTLRLWRAEAPESFNFSSFNRGDYYGAVNEKVFSENITKVLYPNDEQVQGKELRLEQQYFFVSCSLQDMLRILVGQNLPVERFHEKFAVQLNDTHPAISVAELMRLLIDEHDLDWDTAWSITEKTFAYTNHTLLPEALEKWPVYFFEGLFPRLMEIIYEINRHFLNEVRVRFMGDEEKVRNLSIIEEDGESYVRMAHLACVGSHTINGVAELHTELLKSSVLADCYAMWPEKFRNVTNGVTPRRWVLLSNPLLSRLMINQIGSGWITDLEKLQGLEPYAEDAGFRTSWRETKLAAKHEFADFLKRQTGIIVNPESMFDIQVKRIHEYKRQHLNVLHIIYLYFLLKSNPQADIAPRTFIFGGKAAPGYRMAKLMIKFINSVGDVINRDPAVNEVLRVVFVPNYNVKNGQRVYPAADLSEQISTAGMEASGTGNMKFSMNGALTIGTLDGANVEIRQAVGAENFFLFGATVEELEIIRQQGYQPHDYYQSNLHLREVIDLIQSGLFSNGDTELFRPIIDSLLSHDPYFLLADFQSYVDSQEQVNQAYKDQDHWSRMSILNVARMGRFSSDRAIQEYCEGIWEVEPVKIRLEDYLEDSKTCFPQTP